MSLILKTILSGILAAILAITGSTSALAQGSKKTAKEEIRYKININELDAMPDGSTLSPKVRKNLIDDIVRGFDMWNDLDRVPVRFTYEGETDAKFGDADNINVVQVTMDASKFEKESAKRNKPDAHALIDRKGDSFDILANGQGFLAWTKFGVEEKFGWHLTFSPKNEYGVSIQMVMAHEAGHALHLGHSKDANSMMYEKEQKRIIPLSEEDILRAREQHRSEKGKTEDKKAGKEKKVGLVPYFGWMNSLARIDDFETSRRSYELHVADYPDYQFESADFRTFSRARAGLDFVCNFNDRIGVRAGAGFLWGCKRQFKQGYFFIPNPSHYEMETFDLRWTTFSIGADVTMQSPFETLFMEGLAFHAGANADFNTLNVEYDHVYQSPYGDEFHMGSLTDHGVGFSMAAGVDFLLWRGLSLGLDVGYRWSKLDHVKGELTNQDEETYEGELGMTQNESGEILFIHPAGEDYCEESRPAVIDLSGLTFEIGLSYNIPIHPGFPFGGGPSDNEPSGSVPPSDDLPSAEERDTERQTYDDENPPELGTPKILTEAPNLYPHEAQRCGTISVIRGLLKLGWIQSEDAVEGDMLKPEYVKGFDKYLNKGGKSGLNPINEKKALEDHLPSGKKLDSKEFLIDHIPFKFERSVSKNRKKWNRVKKLVEEGWVCFLGVIVRVEKPDGKMDNFFHGELITKITITDDDEIWVQTDDSLDQGTKCENIPLKPPEKKPFRYTMKHMDANNNELDPVVIRCYRAK